MQGTRLRKNIFKAIFIGNLICFLYFFLADTYPLPLIFINILSIAVLWLWVLDITHIRRFFDNHAKDILITFVIFFIAFGIRIYRVEELTPGMWGDEVGYAILGEQLVDAHHFVPFSNDLFAPPTPFLYLIGWTVRTLGRTLTTVRLPGIVFGALGVAAAYWFLLTIFGRKFAVAGTAVMLVLYHHIIISRFAYEMTATTFFEFLALLFLYRAYAKGQLRDFAGCALSIGGGLYTYLAFRTNAVALFFILLLLLLVQKWPQTKKRIFLTVIACVFFISLVPWLSFAARHPAHVMARATALSIFSSTLPQTERMKEIIGSTKRSFGMFTTTGDPNPRLNPSQKAMYDPILVVLSVIGLAFLFIKKRRIAVTGLFLMLPSFVNDIFSLERIPEFHYYGIGHPSTTRVLGLIPIMLFFMVTGLNTVDKIIKKLPIRTNILSFSLLTGLTVAMVGINWSWYFFQPPSENIYGANGLKFFDVLSFISRSRQYNVSTIGLSSLLYHDQRVQYFSDKRIKLIPLDISGATDSAAAIPPKLVTLVDVQSTLPFSNKLIEPAFIAQNNLDVHAIITQFKFTDILIVYKKS